MFSNKLTIQKYLCAGIHRSEMKQNPSTIKRIGGIKCTTIFQRLVMIEMLLQPRKLAFRTKRDQYLFVKLTISNRQFPLAVEINEAVPAHLGTGVHLPGLSTQVFALIGHQINHDTSP